MQTILPPIAALFGHTKPRSHMGSPLLPNEYTLARGLLPSALCVRASADGLVGTLLPQQLEKSVPPAYLAKVGVCREAGELPIPIPPKRKSISRLLLGAVNRERAEPDVMVADLLAELGDRSFGWAMLLFALINLLPLPIGSTLITALPLMVITLQMAFGFDYVRLPRFLTKRRISRAGLRRMIFRLRPVTRRIDKVIRPRHTWLFSHQRERMLGVALFFVALALFMPIPFSGWFPAFALMISAFGIIERDGLVTLIGVSLGIFSIALTAEVVLSLVAGARAVM
jgi:hypothetical protein